MKLVELIFISFIVVIFFLYLPIPVEITLFVSVHTCTSCYILITNVSITNDIYFLIFVILYPFTYI